MHDLDHQKKTHSENEKCYLKISRLMRVNLQEIK